jgi:protein-disulfide isomerase
VTSRLGQLANVGLISVCVLLSALIGLRLWNEWPKRQSTPVAVVDVGANNIVVRIGDRPQQGRRNARLALVEFSDFQCPFCGVFARETYPLLLRDYVNTGKVVYLFRHLPLPNHPLAQTAAHATECAFLHGKFWELRERLFANQARLTLEDLIGHGVAVGLERSTLQSCLNEAGADPSLKADRVEAARLGIRSTPTFLLGPVDNNGQVQISKRIVGAQSYAVFQRELDSLK